MAVDPTLIDLQEKYQPLVIAGMTSTFQASCQGELIMPQTGNPRDVLLGSLRKPRRQRQRQRRETKALMSRAGLFESRLTLTQD